MSKRRREEIPRDYDPYDPEKPRERPTAGPRLVDVTKPLPPPDQGRPVPRPHQIQTKVKPEAIVPPEDNPLRGWRGVGAFLLDRNLWPQDARLNPVMVYYTGRSRGRWLEDVMGFVPWIALLILDGWFMFTQALTFNHIWIWGLIETVAMGFIAAAYSASMLGVHCRRILGNFPMEELMLTRLKAVDIVQGISIRPLAVQVAAITFATVAHIFLALTAEWWMNGTVSVSGVAYVAILVVLRWYFLTNAVEGGGALAVRAFLCIRSPLIAGMKVVMDGFELVFSALVVTIGLMAGMLVACLLVSLFSFGFVTIPYNSVYFWTIPPLFFFINGLVVALRSVANDAMDWCHFYPGEWWISAEKLNAAEDASERGLFTPWEPVRGRKGLFKRMNVQHK